MNLQTAYGPDVTSPYIRSIEYLSDSGEILLRDESENAENEDSVLNFITYDQPVLTSNHTLQIGETTAVFEGASGPFKMHIK